MDLASSHCPGQYLIKRASNLAQQLLYWSYSHPAGLAVSLRCQGCLCTHSTVRPNSKMKWITELLLQLWEKDTLQEK